jgi:hypothetical protein
MNWRKSCKESNNSSKKMLQLLRKCGQQQRCSGTWSAFCFLANDMVANICTQACPENRTSFLVVGCSKTYMGQISRPLIWGATPQQKDIQKYLCTPGRETSKKYAPFLNAYVENSDWRSKCLPALLALASQ